jgi:hypothetical protein
MADAMRVMNAANTNLYFRAAVERNPAYGRAIAVRETALAAQRRFPPAAAPLSPLLADVGLDDWLDAMLVAEAAERDRKARLFQLEELVRDCNNQIGGVMLQPDPLLRLIAKDLDKLMNQVRTALPGLRGATNPSEAINLGVADQWKNLDALRETYDDIRSGQSLVIDGDDLGRQYRQAAKSSYLTERGIDDPLASDLAVANLDDIWIGWRKPPTIGLGREPIDGRPGPAEPVAQLVWLASGDVEVWIPTLAELDELAADRRERMNPNPRRVPGIVPAPINSPNVIRKPVYEITT